ncbi:pirin family protein [Achromobacter sp. F4_2707]|uniref:pirin family protein n=1 Tax=Achromobacter sp. F4_2707 TaxID=3114286 RepID=UPI0039C63DCA
MQFIDLRKAELGAGFTVGRALPTRERRLIGAWCFLDHLGPVELRGNAGMHVEAHPHTCLQTFTWMMEGEILHRDSLGSEQVVRPGEVNLMTAGRGIAHTEDSLQGERLHAAQLWIALPEEHADIEPAFNHYPELPRWSHQNIECTLLVGEFEGKQAPARVYTPLVGLDLHAHKEGRMELPLRPDFEYGLLPLQGNVSINNVDINDGKFVYLEPGGATLDLSFSVDTRCLLIGGEPFPATISMWWNFVAHSREYINQAYQDWQSGSNRFPPVPGATHRLDSPRPAWLPATP